MYDPQDKSNYAKWLTAGCAACTVGLIFIAATVYMGTRPEGYRPRPPFTDKAYAVDTFRVPGPVSTPYPERDFGIPPVNIKPLVAVQARETLEEMFSGTEVKESSSRKKSEAVFPAWSDPDASRNSLTADPENLLGRDADFGVPGFGDAPAQNRNDEPESEETVRDEETIFTFLQNRLKDVYGLMEGERKRSLSPRWLGVLDAVNKSITDRDASVVVDKLKDIYYNETEDLEVPSGASVLGNTTSLVSFGLLAIDLFLLHNVQQIAWSEEKEVGAAMLRDPEVVAMNALFLAPDRVEQLRRSQSRFLEEPADKGALQELLDFFGGAVRAVTNLSRAYRKGTAPVGPRTAEANPLDCLWTLYCRNLDKTAKLEGPYGFLAKINSLGLRLMMGEFPVERAVEKLLTEATLGWGSLNCTRLFPRCSALEAQEVVLETALGENGV